MKQKLTTLPINIRKFNKYFYKDYSTGNLIHVDNLYKHCPKNQKLKHELIINKRYDLRQD